MSAPDRSPDQFPELGCTYRTIGDRQVLFDGEGFLWYPEDWSEPVAEALALDSGLDSLTAVQWRVLRYLREFYLGYGRAPLNRQFAQGVGLNLLALEGLFPGGIKHGARRLAGLPNPKTCL